MTETITRMLTTLDNPYNPHTQFDEWDAFDRQKGYNTLAYMARIAYWSDELSEKEKELEYDRVIDEILEYNVTGNYILAPVPNKK